MLLRRLLLALPLGLAALAARGEPRPLPPPDRPVATVAEASGELRVLRGDLPLPFYPEIPLYAGDLVAASGGSADLVLSDGSIVHLVGESALRLAGTRPAPAVAALRGCIAGSFVSGAWREVLQAGGARASTGGAVLAVEVVGGEAWIGVAAGSVDVVGEKVRKGPRRPLKVLVNAGQMVLAAPGDPPTIPEPFAPRELCAPVPAAAGGGRGNSSELSGVLFNEGEWVRPGLAP